MSLLSKVTFTPLLLSLYLIRLMVFGASIGDAIAMSALAALYGFNYFIESKKEAPINDTLKARLDDVERDLHSLKVGQQTVKMTEAKKNIRF